MHMATCIKIEMLPETNKCLTTVSGGSTSFDNELFNVQCRACMFGSCMGCADTQGTSAGPLAAFDRTAQQDGDETVDEGVCKINFLMT